VYFSRNGKVFEVEWEISGVPEYDFLLWWETDCKRWVHPDESPTTEEEQREIFQSLKGWLDENGHKTDLPATFQPIA
jgi:hypothetical protein